MSRSIDMRTAWNRTSDPYQRAAAIPTDAASYGPLVPTEAELRLLGTVRGRCILELGCGGGQCSVAFAREGALVTGLDLSDAQIAFARRLAQREGVSVAFEQGDAADLSRFADGSFDIVFSAYALQYVAEIERCLAEVRRVLAPNGRFVFSLDHPFRNCFWDEEQDENTATAVRSYFRRGAMEWQFDVSRQWMRSFHRTLGDWVDLLHGAGLRLERLLEPEPAQSWHASVPFDETFDLQMAYLIPQTVIFVAS